MTATAAEIAELRRKVGERTSETYTDEVLQEYIERYPLTDARGENPLIESTTTPGTLEENPDWTATYDLNAAAADIWAEKAAEVYAKFDFKADGGSHQRSQVYENAMKQSRYYRARRSITTITQFPEPLMQGSEEVSD